VANVKVRLYQSIKVASKWMLRRAPEQRLRQLSIGRYYVRFGNRMEPAGQDPAVALAVLRRKQAELTFIAIGGEVKRNESTTDEQKRVKLVDAAKEYIADCRDRQGKSGYGLAPRTVEAYEYRLGFLTAFRPDAYLDEIDTAFVRAFRRYLREHPDDLSDRSCYNAMQAVSTFLVRNNNMAAKAILREMSFPPRPVIPYSDDELTKFFAACTQEESIIFKFFLHSMAREREVAFTEVRDLLLDRNVLHISPKPDKGFRLKGKRSGQAKNWRRVPMPAAYVATLREFCKGKSCRILLFPNAQGGIENHFLRRCEAIAKRSGLVTWNQFDLHRWRKTGATRHHESGVSVRKIQAWLGHESLEVTLDYLGVEDAADQHSQEQVNSGALAAFV
jgi:integrase